MAKPRLPDALIWGVDAPDVDHGDDTRGGSGSYVKMDAMGTVTI